MNEVASGRPVRTQKLSVLLAAHNAGLLSILSWYKARFDYPRRPGVKDEKGR